MLLFSSQLSKLRCQSVLECTNREFSKQCCSQLFYCATHNKTKSVENCPLWSLQGPFNIWQLVADDHNDHTHDSFHNVLWASACQTYTSSSPCFCNQHKNCGCQSFMNAPPGNIFQFIVMIMYSDKRKLIWIFDCYVFHISVIWFQ